MTELSGAYRCINREEYTALKAAGANVDWAEGCGYIVYDQQALEQFQAECADVQRRHQAYG